MQKLPFNAKTKSETCTGIRVSYEKCWQILKLRNIKCRKVIHYSYGGLDGTINAEKRKIWDF
jgi:hypothetical protein